MTTKLTLSVDKRIVEKAKRYARKHNKSLSEIVTNYLDFLSNDRSEKVEIDPAVLAVSDEIAIDRIPSSGDTKYQYLRDKYLHG